MKKLLRSLWCRMLCLFFLGVTGLNMAYAQQVTVSGVVTDAKKLPIPAASVLLKGTQQGTTTDLNGKFTIKANPGQVLTFKSVGFIDKDVTVGASKTINVTLEETNAQLNEVVVIGYGTQKKANVSGALSSMKNTNLDERPITRVDQALVGQLAGVNVKQNSGLPGKAFSVQVRGTASISAGNEPLYVIDGFPLALNSSNASTGNFSSGNPLDNINPADIESIDVLKDAAAAAIYGSRATNGVVIITTKHGKTGKPKISFNNSFGYNAASKQLNMLNGDEWIARATDIINNSYLAKAGSVGASASDDAATRRAKLNQVNVPVAAGAVNTDYMLDPRWAIPGHPGLTDHNWQKLIERNGLMQNSQLTAQGGTDAVSYYVSGAYQNQNSFIKSVGYKQYSARANVDINVSKKLKVGFNLAPTYSVTNDPGVEGKDNIFHQALSMTPLQEDSVGNYPNIGKNAPYTWSNSTNGPLGKLENNVGVNKRYRTLATAYGQYEIISGLVFKSSVNFDNTDNQSNTYVPYITTGSTLASRTYTGAAVNNLLAAISGSYGSYKRQTFVNENTLNYNKTFNSVHNLSLLLGQSYNYDRFDQASFKSNGGYLNASIQTLSAAAGITGTTTSTLNVLVSYFARAQYSFKDKYLLSASIRTDGSSRFGSNTKYGWFPAASLGWRVVQEDFMKNVKFVSDLKLRASYGVNGNNGIGDYSTIPQIGTSNYVLGSQVSAIGQAPSNVVNPNLKWEKSATYDFGFDFGLFANRITGSFDYYNKKSRDLLLNVPVLETTGFTSMLTNIGAVNGIGQELEITSRNTTGAFQWSTTLNISHNSNKIVALGPGQNQIIIPNTLNVSDAILRVGESLNSVYVLKYNGFLTAADIAAGYPRYGNEAPGDPKFEDLNHDGVITEADKQIVGHPNPSFTGGITNTFRYKDWDLSILIQGQSGGVIYSELARALARPGQGFKDNTPQIFTDRWYSESNTGSGRFGKAYSTYNTPITATQDAVYSTNYYRVRDITLGYNLKHVLKTNSIQGARVYVSMENFFGGDKYYGGLNPDAANIAVSSNSNYAQSGDYGGLPLAKSLIFGVNFTF